MGRRIRPLIQRFVIPFNLVTLHYTHMLRRTLTLAILLMGSTLWAQDVLRIGITGSGALNMHSGSLTTADGLLECGTFTDATTLGWMAGNALWLPITDKLAFSGRLQYWDADGTFSAPNDVQPNVSLPDGSLVRMQSEYQLQTTLDYINLDLLALWYFTPELFVGLGPQIGFNTRASFAQTEKILEPSYLEFTQGGQERTFLSSTFAQNGVSTTIRIALQAMVGYDIRVHPQVVVTPEVGYARAFTNVLSGSDWLAHALRAGVTVSWAIQPDDEPEPPKKEEPVIVRQPEPVAAPVRSMNLEVESRFADGKTFPGADIVITETRNSDVVPLLPFVFFETNSAAIPTRYHAFAGKSFDEAALQDSVLGVYHSLLDIVGSRMIKYPDSKLTVTGYREPTDGENSAQLSASRAQAIKDYLSRNWGIGEQRIQTAAGVLPSIVSTQSTQDGRTENRRAELAASDPRILAPVSLNKIERTAEPASITIKPTFATPADVTNISAELAIGSNRVAGPLTANGASGITWNVDVAAVSQAIPMYNRAAATGVVRTTATYADGTKDEKGAMVSARRFVRSTRFSNEIVNDSVVERFRLIFFDFDSPTVSEFNRSMIDLVRSRIRTNSALRITGLTDRIGPVEHNQTLSAKRAAAIETSIKQRVIPAVSQSSGAGPMLIYNNNLPEGRWYNRTVLIEVATPVESVP